MKINMGTIKMVITEMADMITIILEIRMNLIMSLIMRVIHLQEEESLIETMMMTTIKMAMVTWVIQNLEQLRETINLGNQSVVLKAESLEQSRLLVEIEETAQDHKVNLMMKGI